MFSLEMNFAVSWTLLSSVAKLYNLLIVSERSSTKTAAAWSRGDLNISTFLYGCVRQLLLCNKGSHNSVA